MKPKDGFVKGPYKKGFLMHVTTTTTTMVNPFRIGSCDQKEAISIIGSEIGADTSPEEVTAAAGSF